MNNILNQLNKVKNISETSGKLKFYDIDSKVASEIIRVISCEESEDFKHKKLIVYNSKSGIMHIGFSLKTPLYICSKLDKHIDPVFIENLSKFSLPLDVISSTINPFFVDFFDIAIVSPELDKEKATSTYEIESSLKISKRTYFCYKIKEKEILKQRIPNNIELLATILVSLPQSSKYSKPNTDPEEFGIFRTSI